MATVAAVPSPALRLPTAPLHRLTVAQYHQMIAAGVLKEGEHVELLDGWLVEKMTHNPPHATAVDLAQTEIAACLPGGWRTRTQSAITLATSEPEPDIAVVRGPARRYFRSHPRPKDIAWLVEVAESTLFDDRNFKGPLYARARISVYWIINLIDYQVEVYSEPRAGRNASYQQRQDFGIRDSVPLMIDGREIGRIAVRKLLP
jgi:Uma2 family endonuclease